MFVFKSKLGLIFGEISEFKDRLEQNVLSETCRDKRI